MANHSWEYGEAGPEFTGRRTCRKCHVQARRFGHGAGSYWDYTTREGTFLGVTTRVPKCPPTEPERIPMRVTLLLDKASEELRACPDCIKTNDTADGMITALLCQKHEVDEIFRRIGLLSGDDGLGL